MEAPFGTKGGEAEEGNMSGSRPREQNIHDVNGALVDS